MWRLAANHVTGQASVAPDTLCAFANWLSGDGTQALIAVGRAHAIAPTYSMAGLVLSTLDGGMSPELWDGFDTKGVA